MIIANFGLIGKSAEKTSTSGPVTAIRERHEPIKPFVVYDVRPRTLRPVDKLLIIRSQPHQD